ncbi:MAG: energy-coupling factor transporter ATPase [Clostridiaceae bacterium]|nr:energy-coupling factor transporter ATPase [Clostridiaceae bacterium]MDY5015025.1 energy-coupling factor transporter ATPase [Eubacteriales bacterium]
MSTILETRGLRYEYGSGLPSEVAALDGVDIRIEEGEFVGLIGHTGSGKSTLIQHFNGLLAPTSGQVLFRGQDIHEKGYRLRELRFRVGLVFQYPEYQLFEETVEKDISFGPRNMGLSEDEIRERVRMAASYVGLTEDVMDKSPFDLSGGQKRRVAIAGVLAMKPEVLILDEPTAGLDPEGASQILREIRAFREESGTTVILVSHNMEDVARTADRLIVMNHAKVALEGTPEQVFGTPERLESLGLDVPQVTKIFWLLKQRGVDVETSVYTVKYAKNLILKMIGGGASC